MKILRKSRLVVLLAVMSTLWLTACKNQNSDDNGKVNPNLVTNPVTASGEKTKSDLPVMTFDNDEHDFGLIVEGEKVEHTFKFTNTGGSDLIISNVSATCGCTIPSWSREPVKPGGKGSIDVVFNSSGRPGVNNKEVKVLTNAQPNTIKLTFRAEVYSQK